MELSSEIPFQESEESLVERALKQDKTAFASLYERYVAQIYRHAYYRVRNQADAEDITEETFIRAWKAIGKYQQRGAPFVAWLLKIVRNLIIDYYKAKKNYVQLEKVENAASESYDPLAITEAILDKQRLEKAIKRLKGNKREVINLHFIDGFSYAEIANILKKSEGAVRVIQYRALIDLKAILTETE